MSYHETILRTVILLALIFPCTLHADDSNHFVFSNIGLERGLSHSTVFSIGQDKEGFLWLATYDGVNKYDGYNFTIYRHESENPNSIASDISRCIAIDDADRVWVGTREGLSCYNHQQDAFSNYYYHKDGQNVAVTCLASLKHDQLMVGTDDGILIFDVKSESFLPDSLYAPLHKLIPDVLTRQEESVYIGTRNGVYIYNVSSNIYEKITALPSNAKLQAALYQKFGKIWLGTEGDGLYLYDLKKRELKNFRSDDGRCGLNSNYVRSLSLDTENRLWIGTYGGLNIYKEGTERFTTVCSSDIQAGSLSSNSVRCIFQDTQGGMWLGTYWGGLNYYHPLRNRFQSIKHIPMLNSLSDNVVSYIVEDSKHNLWIGTNNGGLNHFDSNSFKFKNYLFESERLDEPFKDIKTICVDESSDIVYVGAHAGGLMALNRKSGHVKYYNRNNSNLPSNNLYSIITDGSGGLWIASLEYLFHFDVTNRNFSIITDDANSIKQHNRLLYRDSQYRIWGGGERGISVFIQNGTSLIPDKSFQPAPVLLHAFVNCFYETSDGNIWIGTRNGLFALNKEKQLIAQYYSTNGLPSSVIYGVLEDAYGRLWISTNQGLSCLDPKSGKLQNYTMTDGLQGHQFNAGAYCRKEDGYMLFGGVNGITTFRPETLIDNPYTPKAIINKLFVYNKEVKPNDETGILKKSISSIDYITLTPSQNSFAISFVVSNYIAGQHNTFAYKLAGYDKEWYKQSDIQPVTYSNLPAGDYTFYVKAANNDGKWNDNPTVLHIRILPVWYRTWWAVLFFVLVLVLIVMGIIHFFWYRKNIQTEIQMERLEKEKQEEINKMKISFYVNISHELRTPLTLIVAPLQELLARVNGQWEHEKLLYIQRNASRLLHLVNQLMDFRRAELGIFELQVGYSNAYKCVFQCFTNYGITAKRKNIDYNFYSELQDKEVLFDKNYLDLIANNLLSNAFKYTDSGKSITVRLYLEKNQLALQVSDTGMGIPEEKQKKIFERFFQVECGRTGSGIGLSLIQRLVELHHGHIVLQSQIGEGSVFTIYLPQDESVYTQEEFLIEKDSSVEPRVYSTNAKDIFIDDDELSPNSSDDKPTECGERYGSIMIVEDNVELRRYLIGGLSGLFKVISAENGQVALEILKNEEVDLIITDVMMPIMNGVKLCKAVKQNIRTCHIPVYMLSAKTDIKCQLEGLHVGADDYIAKPFSIAVLKSKILNVIRTRNRIFEHYAMTPEVEPEKLANNTMDEELLRKAIAVVEKNIDNGDFSTEQFASDMNMSRSNLHLKLKAITGESAINFIQKIRFNRACQLLKEGKYTVAEICFMVGYNTPSYFAARFKKYVGCLPTEYIKNNELP